MDQRLDRAGTNAIVERTSRMRVWIYARCEVRMAARRVGGRRFIVASELRRMHDYNKDIFETGQLPNSRTQNLR